MNRKEFIALTGIVGIGGLAAVAKPEPTRRADSCYGCKYFIASNSTSGTCHRYPPNVGPSMTSQFSNVRNSDWCGEFQTVQNK